MHRSRPAVGGRVRPVSDRAALLAASGHDPFVRFELDPGAGGGAPVRGWAGRGAWAFLRPRPPGLGGHTLTALGAPEAVGPLVAEVVPLLGADVGWVTMTRGAALPPQAGDGDDWDWFWTRQQPQPQPGEGRVVALPDDAAVRAEVAALLQRASPRHSARPGRPGVLGWAGIRDGAGRLVACAAHTENVPGVPHLASVATDPVQRGRGLGAAVTAALTRRLLAAGAPAVTLGMYADNDVARRLYARLGFVREHALSSRRLSRPPHGERRDG
ncbi:acetyltransferase (GNAT) family protein [Kineococcus xinjiangensis]|uniref:Acetyltransferase (GNAT) family protein n=1 Tax=Kineococcus xinjiangensis TaxID=512762 RepID=A0A2S6IP01_9ACTN|nr:GNAT family N-acetyltransferase [Kineococcus xinjiangensis]PPK95987.1 acetyltransferase (GNAT) family protein [Kineococcus xinjiangensis]